MKILTLVVAAVLALSSWSPGAWAGQGGCPPGKTCAAKAQSSTTAKAGAKKAPAKSVGDAKLGSAARQELLKQAAAAKGKAKPGTPLKKPVKAKV